jgi:hypothetical protein
MWLVLGGIVRHVDEEREREKEFPSTLQIRCFQEVEG